MTELLYQPLVEEVNKAFEQSQTNQRFLLKSSLMLAKTLEEILDSPTILIGAECPHMSEVKRMLAEITDLRRKLEKAYNESA